MQLPMRDERTMRSFGTQLAGQVGESLVVAELGRRGIVATSFARNVPDIDLLAYANQKTAHIQVKALRHGAFSLDALRYIEIKFESTRQIPKGIIANADQDLIYVFVNIGAVYGQDRYFILLQSDLQSIVLRNYSSWLALHNYTRPRNPTTTHTAVQINDILDFENNWRLIEERLFQSLPQ